MESRCSVTAIASSLTVLLLMGIATCAHAQQRHGVEQFLVEPSAAVTTILASPCEDSLLAVLRSRDPGSLSESEREYVRRLTTACEEARSGVRAPASTGAPGASATAPGSDRASSIALPAVAVVLVGILLYFALRSATRDTFGGVIFEATTPDSQPSACASSPPPH